MRVAILIPSLEGGGAERIAHMLGEYYYDQGCEVYFYLLYEMCSIAYGVRGNIVYIPGAPLEGTQVNELRDLIYCAGNVRRAKEENKIDVTISFMELCNSLNVMSKGSDKVIISIRTILSKRSTPDNLWNSKKWISQIYNLADDIVAVSEYARKDLIDNYAISADKIRTIPNPAVVRDNVVSSEEWKYGDAAIVCVGRLSPVKQQDRIVKAFLSVLRERIDAKLIFLGDGQTRAYLEWICDELCIRESVVFAGYTSKIGYYFKHSKVFVMASKAEGFPNAMVEAMAYGLPIVTTDCPGGIGEIIGKKGTCNTVCECEYGIMTPYMSGRAVISKEVDYEEDCLGNALLRVLNDSELRKKYIDWSLRRAKYYDYKVIIDMWNQALRSPIKEWEFIRKIRLKNAICLSRLDASRKNNSKKQDCLQLKDELVKSHEFYALLIGWISIYQNKKSIEKYFKDKGYQTIAICGMKELGMALLNELKETDISVDYVIDRNAESIFVPCKTVKPDDPLEEVDAIVVTAIHYFKDIEKQLKMRVKCDVISLEKVISELI